MPPKRDYVDAASAVIARSAHVRARGGVGDPRRRRCAPASRSRAPGRTARALVARVQRAELGRLRDRHDAGLDACSSPIATTRVSTSSGVSLPSGVGTVSSLIPPSASGAPHSSTLRCALSAQINACCGRSIAASPTTLAPVPLNTGNDRGVAESPRRPPAAARPRVRAVGRRVAVVGGGDRLHRLGQYGGVVVAGESTHGARR